MGMRGDRLQPILILKNSYIEKLNDFPSCILNLLLELEESSTIEDDFKVFII